MSPVWRRGVHVAEVRSDDLQTVALVQLDAGTPKVLDGTAATIWCLMDGQRSQDDISAILVEEFDDAEGIIPSQVGAFFEALAEEALVEVAFHMSGPAPGPRNADKE
jgi:hypothetical protein